MLNPDLKRELIESGTASQYRKKRSEMRKKNALADCEKAKSDPDLADAIFGLSTEDVIECERIRNNALRQRNKIEDHLKFLIQGNWTLYFLTLTFDDKTLRSTTFKTRKTTITRILSSFCDDYILNVDYGTKNEREHFHAIIVLLSKYDGVGKDEEGHITIADLDEKYKYGFYRAEEIRTDKKDAERLSRYITKLTMHSVKVKQNYVSVKKGSPYQTYVDLYIRMCTQNRSNGRLFKTDYEKEFTHLLSGYFEGTDA